MECKQYEDRDRPRGAMQILCVYELQSLEVAGSHT